MTSVESVVGDDGFAVDALDVCGLDDVLLLAEVARDFWLFLLLNHVREVDGAEHFQSVHDPFV